MIKLLNIHMLFVSFLFFDCPFQTLYCNYASLLSPFQHNLRLKDFFDLLFYIMIISNLFGVLKFEVIILKPVLI